MAHLRCFYSHSYSDWLRLAPFKIEVNSYDPFHAVVKNLMFENECDEIKDYLGPRLNFPPGRMNTKSRKNDWTMKKYGYNLPLIRTIKL